jgi:predicted dehydrogenase
VDQVRFGVIGIGNMGSHHLRSLNGKLPGAKLTAMCDSDPKMLEKRKAEFPDVPQFVTHKELLASGLVDAIVIATPHYDHCPIALDAFAAGVHVMCEKPLAVSVNAGRKLIAEYEAKYKDKVAFAIMFNQRTNTVYRKLKDLVASGELGEIKRITWIITDWFRTWNYYASGGWRATWAGEGGGVLINQCPHNLDLIQWITGMMPKRIIAHASVGRYHPIEVEDDVHATLVYENGAVGQFITSTGECPGSNRLEISCDRGRVVVDDGSRMSWRRSVVPVQEYNQTTDQAFQGPELWDVNVPTKRQPEQQHDEVMKVFIKHLLDGRKTPLIAEGPEGIRGLELGNAMLMAGLTGNPVELPVNGDAFDAFILDLTKKYGGKKTLATKDKAESGDFASSFR